MRRLLIALSCLVATGCGAVEDWLFGPADPGDREPVRFTVPKGATARSLGDGLDAAGLADAGRWRLYLRLSGEGACLKAGDFELRRSMALPEILATLCGPPLPDDIPFTVVEGWRIREIDAALAAAGLIEPGAYAARAATPAAFEVSFPVEAGDLEGYLYPDTYMIPARGFTADHLIRRQLEAFGERFGSEVDGQLDGRTLHQVVIVASMVEREEPDPDQRPTVAGVLWKRLDSGWNLGVDATSRYLLPDWNDRQAFLKRLRDPADPYNTRLRGGLPPGPIGNPGLAALRAALEPVESPYWYYLHDREGTVHFGRTSGEHEANRRRYDVW